MLALAVLARGFFICGIGVALELKIINLSFYKKMTTGQRYVGAHMSSLLPLSLLLSPSILSLAFLLIGEGGGRGCAAELAQVGRRERGSALPRRGDVVGGKDLDGAERGGGAAGRNPPTYAMSGGGHCGDPPRLSMAASRIASSTRIFALRPSSLAAQPHAWRTVSPSSPGALLPVPSVRHQERWGGEGPFCRAAVACVASI